MMKDYLFTNRSTGKNCFQEQAKIKSKQKMIIPFNTRSINTSVIENSKQLVNSSKG